MAHGPTKIINNAGEAALDGSSRYGREDEADADSSVFVKYNRMLHGRKTERGQKRDTLTIKFLKKYIHYAKHRIQPELTDEVGIVLFFSYIYIYIYICVCVCVCVCVCLFIQQSIYIIL